MNDNAHLLERIEELEAALKPFADAAEGFKENGRSLDLEYQESNGEMYILYIDDAKKFPLKVAHLIDAAKAMKGKYS